MRRMLLAIVAALLAGSPAGGGEPARQGFAMHRERLPNGLEVILQPDPNVTSVVVQVWFHVGSKDETAGRTGFAHLFEHLMFEGSRHVEGGQFDLLLEEAGGWNNGSTTNDRTNYIEQVPANYLELALWLEADRLAGLWDAMDQEVLDNQREVVKNERRESYENQPYGMAEIALQQALWPEGHGNHNLTIGTMDDLTAASLDDVEAFWRKWYVPSNATLVICGGFDLEATRALVARYFGWMPTRPRPAGRELEAPVEPLDGPVELTGTDQVEASKVLVRWRIDAPFSDDEARLDVASQLLGGGKTSRLYRRLVFTERLATEVYAYISQQMLGGELQIEAVVRDGVEPEAVRDAIREEVAALAAAPPAGAELERAQRVLEASRLAGLENLASRAEAIAEWAAYTGDPDHLDEELAQLRAIGPADVQAAVARWLAPEAAVTMIVRPR